MTAVNQAQVLFWSAAEVDAGDVPEEHLSPVREILAWARKYLVSPHPDLGRNGPVCPYTQPSLHKGLFHLAALSGEGDVGAAVESLRGWYERLGATLPAADRELLTVLLVLPHLDHTDASGLDELQRVAKDKFVEDGLMIGQFHPVCDAPGLWNPEFRALRAPVPLLAIRKLVVFDLPFLVDHKAHAESYIRRFAPEIPPRIRKQLAQRLTY
ncbi:DUF6875 domain-containing protein [Kutzneria sp. CA-103260]|uniref:DUF6875 domain-containing protein n=1 Tax=Kutzneria sp. CA-103260 TaxID=2802641 RepID=UPI001BA8D423|nr:hypothetical protein [Kutzneria sp. CA-103260]QUQ65166.1 hypothetical protein JJ691_28870 [Kutzneria sp. CA-103260]